jgi:hypothetical protein
MVDALSNFTLLKAAVEDWLETHDVTLINRIPEAISLIEMRLNRRYVPPAAYNRRSHELLADLGEHHITLPPETVEVQRVHLTATPKYPLDQLSSSQLMRQYPETTRGRPKAFAMIGEVVELSHIPDQDYIIRIASRQRIWPLGRDISEVTDAELQSHIVRDETGDAVEENYWTKHAADLLLYGACMNAEIFNKNPKRALEFKGMYLEASDGMREYVFAKRHTENIGTHTPRGVMIV